MRVAVVADFEMRGGAGVAAGRLAAGLVSAGHEVTWVTKAPSEGDHPWDARELRVEPPRGMHRMGKRAVDLVAKRQIRSAARKMLREIAPDVVSIHNMHGATDVGWSVEMIEECDRVAPAVWTLHDMWSFTGGCAYSFDCFQYRQGCDHRCSCPDGYPKGDRESLRPEWNGKERLARKAPSLSIVAPSRWLAAEAASGLWREHRIEHIPYGLPLDIYKPVDRGAARRRLGLGSDGLIALVAALDLSERRKGSEMLGSLSDLLRVEDVTLALAGKSRPETASAGNVIDLGHLASEQRMRDAYNAADIVVHPAPVDNLPNTVMESIACGTPVVGMPVGGVPDMVVPGETGWLADAASPEGLGNALRHAVRELREGKDLRSSCRAYAERNYALDRQARDYEALFSELRAQKR